MLNMRLSTLVLFVSLMITILFIALNWQAFLTPTELSLGVAAVTLPLGMVMLALLSMIVAMFLIYIFFLQGTALVEARRFARELRVNQEKADNAEASRFTEVHQLIREEMAKLQAQGTENQATLIAALDRVRADLTEKGDDMLNTVAAYVGELEDRVDSVLPARQNHP